MRTILAICLALFALPAAALTLAECERTTHVSHGGERGHRDMGAGRVLYGEWWSQEGVYTDLVVADCRAGKLLRTRTREQRISARLPFDRTEKALKIIETEFAASPSLFRLEGLARALKRPVRDIEISMMQSEPCACAALYPEARGNRAPFDEANG